MNTREIAEEYRLSHWEQVMRKRQESGLSIKAFCKKAGFHENVYYYWQRKLREAACEQMTELQLPAQKTSLTAPAFAEVKLTEPPEHQALSGEVSDGQIHIEIGEIRINADSRYPSDKLTMLLKQLIQLC